MALAGVAYVVFIPIALLVAVGSLLILRRAKTTLAFALAGLATAAVVLVLLHPEPAAIRQILALTSIAAKQLAWGGGGSKIYAIGLAAASAWIRSPAVWLSAALLVWVTILRRSAQWFVFAAVLPRSWPLRPRPVLWPTFFAATTLLCAMLVFDWRTKGSDHSQVMFLLLAGVLAAAGVTYAEQ